MVAAPVNKELLNAFFTRSGPLLKLVISKGPIPVQVFDYNHCASLLYQMWHHAQDSKVERIVCWLQA
jgi:hypothetical protein